MLPHTMAQLTDLRTNLSLALVGDLARPNFGLDDVVYEQLCSDVDAIVHNGALVNHAYSYEQLFEPNVLGTIEVCSRSATNACKATPI